MLKFIRNFLVSAGYLGYFPFASGTITSAAIAVIYYLFFDFLSEGNRVLFLPNFLLFSAILILTVIFVPIIRSAEKDLGRDSRKIVIDEILGYLVAVLFMPHSLLVAIYAFITFRIFDIAKPPIIDEVQALPHGWGVIADDLLAGLYANILLQMINLFFPRFF